MGLDDRKRALSLRVLIARLKASTNRHGRFRDSDLPRETGI